MQGTHKVLHKLGGARIMEYHTCGVVHHLKVYTPRPLRWFTCIVSQRTAFSDMVICCHCATTNTSARFCIKSPLVRGSTASVSYTDPEVHGPSSGRRRN